MPVDPSKEPSMIPVEPKDPTKPEIPKPDIPKPELPVIPEKPEFPAFSPKPKPEKPESSPKPQFPFPPPELEELWCKKVAKCPLPPGAPLSKLGAPK
jgi:hypothetical protein